MKFKAFRNLRVSLHPSKYGGRWRSIAKVSSDIVIYIHHVAGACDDVKFVEKHPVKWVREAPVEYVCEYLSKVFLAEYLCSCVMRGNRMKKECTDRKHKHPFMIGCIPHYIMERAFKRLKGQKVRMLRRGQKRLTEFL